MQDAKNPHAAIRTAVQDALVEIGRIDDAADVAKEVVRRLLAPEIGWAFAALRREDLPRTASIRQRRDLTSNPRVTRWYECPSCLWTAVAEYCRYCENCGTRVEWIPSLVVT